jgi:hypothetical protein
MREAGCFDQDGGTVNDSGTGRQDSVDTGRWMAATVTTEDGRTGPWKALTDGLSEGTRCGWIIQAIGLQGKSRVLLSGLGARGRRSHLQLRLSPPLIRLHTTTR